MELRGIRFCKECANILNPVEMLDQDTGEKQLAYSCRVCDYKESAKRPEDMLVYHHQIRHKAELMKIDYKDYPLDATLPRAKVNCPKCGYGEAVYFHSEAQVGESAMKVTYVCARRNEDEACGFHWT